MPRSITVPSRLCEPGTYGPYTLDGITKNNTEEIKATFTVDGWPDVSPLFKVTITWDTGDGVTCEFNGRQIGKDGQPVAQVSLSADVPRRAAGRGNGKANVSGGTVMVEVYQTFTTAVTIVAV